jgi:hypothetical protein
MIVIKFWESRFSIFVETGTKMETIYQRASRWIGVDPRFVELRLD